MAKSRVNSYLMLIQKLLSYPSGEDWIHLKHHENLVDAGFVQVMEQVAVQLMRQEDRATSMFLHNWAAKLTIFCSKRSIRTKLNSYDRGKT